MPILSWTLSSTSNPSPMYIGWRIDELERILLAELEGQRRERDASWERGRDARNLKKCPAVQRAAGHERAGNSSIVFDSIFKTVDVHHLSCTSS
jgi:hypothetical protein